MSVSVNATPSTTSSSKPTPTTTTSSSITSLSGPASPDLRRPSHRTSAATTDGDDDAEAHPSSRFGHQEEKNQQDEDVDHIADAVSQGRPRRLRTSAASGAAELARIAVDLKAALRSFADFPKPGINFVDILPLFANPALHLQLLDALELQVRLAFPDQTPEVIVGLDARGFLFGPGLALRLGCAFAPVRKPGKLPGPTVEAGYEKEYGVDTFAMQADAIKLGQSVLIVDDIIATGGSAAAAGNLIQQLGGTLMGFLFILELDALRGRDKLQAPAMTLLRDESSSE